MDFNSNWDILKFKDFLLFQVSLCVLNVWGVCCMHVGPMDVRRQHLIPWNWSYVWMVTTHCIGLGTESGSSVQTCAFNY